MTITLPPRTVGPAVLPASADVDAIIRLARTVARLERIAGPTDCETDVAIGQRVDIFG